MSCEHRRITVDAPQKYRTAEHIGRTLNAPCVCLECGARGTVPMIVSILGDGPGIDPEEDGGSTYLLPPEVTASWD